MDGNIVLWFALVGILFDAASLGSYLICGRHHTPMADNPFFSSDAPVSEELDSVPDEQSKTLEVVTVPPLSIGSVDEKEIDSPSSPRHKQHIGANMRSALLHLISDSLRSVTTLIEGIILLNFPSGDGAKIDAVATLIVCSVIMVGVVFGIVNWIRDFKEVILNAVPANSTITPADETLTILPSPSTPTPI